MGGYKLRSSVNC